MDGLKEWVAEHCEDAVFEADFKGKFAGSITVVVDDSKPSCLGLRDYKWLLQLEEFFV